MAVAAYIESHPGSAPTVKQHFAAIKMLFAWLVTGQVVPFDPASSVRGPKYIVKKNKTPALSAEDTRKLPDTIVASDAAALTPIDLRDRALIGVRVYSFARIGAALGMSVVDYYVEGRKAWFRLNAKGGKRHEMPAHHNAADHFDAYIAAARIAAEKKSALFRTIDRHGTLTDGQLDPRNAPDMIKRRAKAAGLSDAICNHTFRATGITAYLENGGTIDVGQPYCLLEQPCPGFSFSRFADNASAHVSFFHKPHLRQWPSLSQR